MKTITETIKDQVLKVISGEVNSVSFETEVIPQEFENYMKSINFERGEMDTNGWQWDFWIPFTSEDDPFQYEFAGSGYYGGQTFSIKEEE